MAGEEGVQELVYPRVWDCVLILKLKDKFRLWKNTVAGRYVNR
jgi:hypothetical protein